MLPKRPEEIAFMREAGRKLAEVMVALKRAVRPSVTLLELDSIAEEEIAKRGGVPSFKGYKQRESDTPFPATLCASVNSEVVHGPATRPIALRTGDIVGLDIGLSYQGWNADMAATFPVGTVSDIAQKLMRVTEQSLLEGIRVARGGIRLIEVSRSIYTYITSHGFGVVTGFCGHGIGKNIHEEPMVPNYPSPAVREIELVPGMTLAIEPMVTIGDPALVIDADGWTARTKDGSIAAHFEHTVLITASGAEILTAV